MLDTQSDAELITAARSGDEDAYEHLYRRHSAAALRFARSLAGSSVDAEDVVAEAFARVLAVLRAGNGPEEAFRPYLLAAVRHAFYDVSRRSGRERAMDDVSPFAPDVPFADPVAAEEESTLVATAFGELPERWRVVLWHTEVEGEKPAAVAPILGISANAVAALAYRAREGLRERYLQAHAATARDEACRPTVDQLGAYTRHRLTSAETAKVRAHLDGCDRCALLFGELSDVNARLGVFIGPAILGAGAAGYLPASGVVTVGGTAVGTLRRWASRRESQVGLGVAAVAGLVVLALTLLSADPPPDLVDSSETPMAAPTQARQSPTPGAMTTTPSAPASIQEPGTSRTGQPSSPSASAAPAAVGVTVSLRSTGSLIRGRPGILSLAVTNPSDSATGAMTATFGLPSGVTLRATDAGNGWTCGGSGAITCQKADLAAGASTTAHVRLAVAGTAAAGVPTVTLTGPRIRTVTASAREGITGAGLGAVMAAPS